MTFRSVTAWLVACLTLPAATAPLRAQRDLTELQERAEQGNPSAQYNLARQYVTGTGVPRDDQEAARWYRLAA
ncbi:MAG TPA: sel1 repeat family protein, partial [Acidobacteria bacterium]|nr:sel1 repeat family protein [Acidobacteriota bacterium]